MGKKKKVLVALSGGVDSSVASLLLQKQGYQVHTAFIKTWSMPWMPCTWREERRDAMRIAAILHIPFTTVDLSDAYEKQVVQYFVKGYREGRTPNPDVMCNKYIKFGGFFDYAINKQYDFVATGHYARVQEDKKGIVLLSGVDDSKDQSYFLWTLTQQHLQKILFPIGDMQKSQVRKIAEKHNLPTATKKDSQGICFLGKVNMKDFLTHYIEPKAGAVLNVRGEVIGSHDGAIFVTLGQRHGFTITKKTPNTAPLYVVQKDVVRNTITVAPESHHFEDVDNTIPLHDVNWIGEQVRDCKARLRYNQPLFDVHITDVDGATCIVTPKEKQPYVPYGQSMVFYKHRQCIGGGVIG